MKNLFRFILFILVCAKTTAQYTDIINSNRPGHTENAYSIGKNIIQIENGVSLIFNKYNHSPLQLSYQNNLNIRSGILFEQIEVKAEFVHGIQNIVPIKFKYNLYNTNPSPIYSYLDNTIEFKNIGFKFLAYDHKIKNHNDEIRSWNKRTAFNWSKFIPSIAIKAEYINRKKSDGFEGIGASILLHHKVNSIWNILSNFGYNISKNGVNAEYVASISTNYAFNNNWSSFAETYNIITETKNTYQIAFGFAYLVSKNLQIDFSSRISYFDSHITPLITSGFSWRLDRHKDKFEPKKEKKALITKEQKPYTKLSKNRNSVQKKVPIGAINRNIFQKEKKTKGIFGKLFTSKKPKTSKNKTEKPKRGKNLSKEIKKRLNTANKERKELQKEVLKAQKQEEKEAKEKEAKEKEAKEREEKKSNKEVSADETK